MKKSTSFYFSAGMILALVGFTWLGLSLVEPKAIPKIKWSVVDELSRAQVAIDFSLTRDLEKSDFLILGVPSTEPEWTDLLRLIISARMKLDPRLEVWLALPFVPSLGDLSLPDMIFDLTDTPGGDYTAFGKRLKNHSQGKVLIVTSLADALSFYPETHGGWLRNNGLKSTHVLMAKAILSREHEATAEITCDTSGKLHAVGRLGCEILNLSRLNYRKMAKAKPGIGFLMSQISERDFLALFNFQLPQPQE